MENIDARRGSICSLPARRVHHEDNTMTEPDDREKRPPTKSNQGAIRQRFAEAALKVGLLVSRRDYDPLLSKDHPAKSEDE